MGPGVTGLVKDLRRQAAHARRRPARRLLRAALPQPDRQAAGLHPRLRLRGRRRHADVPRQRDDAPGFGEAYKKQVRDYAGAFISMGGFGEVLPRYENRRASIPSVKDRWGIPVLRFDYKFGDNEKKMAADMAQHGAGDVRGGRHRDRRASTARLLTEGWSIHELGTARMGSDPKTSVLNQFQQSHDVKNLFVVDGSSHVSASCQNPTWTIMALAWRSCDHLADEFRKGNL